MCGHGIVPLTGKKDVTIQPKTKVLVCSEHDYELKHYCETCNELVCLYCTKKNHIGHNHDTVHVKKMVSKHRQELKKITAPVDKIIDGLSDTTLVQAK